MHPNKNLLLHIEFGDVRERVEFALVASDVGDLGIVFLKVVAVDKVERLRGFDCFLVGELLFALYAVARAGAFAIAVNKVNLVVVRSSGYIRT